AAGATVAVIADLQGPKIRLGVLGHPVDAAIGQRLTLVNRTEADGADGTLPLPHPQVLQALRPGGSILFDDGTIEAVVRSVGAGSADIEIVVGGRLSSHRGVAAPGATQTLAALTDKDRGDAAHAVACGVDFVALSFVQTGADLQALRALLDTLHGGKAVGIVAKIETRAAIDHLDDILSAADAVMVARGDLGVEISPQEVPMPQKDIIRRANRLGVPVITATQMLQSMVENPRPTRAEASDVANAILDGTDAVMLSAETAVGKYPRETVAMMREIAAIAETQMPCRVGDSSFGDLAHAQPVTDAISDATVRVADEVGARLIATSTWSGYTARQVARERPRLPIVALTPNESVRRSLLVSHRNSRGWDVQRLRAWTCRRRCLISLTSRVASTKTQAVRQPNLKEGPKDSSFSVRGSMNLLGLAKHGLNSFEQIAILAVLLTAFVSLAYAWLLRGVVLKKDKGTPKMQEVWNAIRIGANSYLNQQLKRILPVIGVLAVVLFLSVYIVKPSQEAMNEFGANAVIVVAIGRTLAFIMGAVFSLLVGQLGMRMAIQANVRAASAARRSFNEALSISYYAGTVTGMLTDGLGLFGGTVIFIIFGTAAPDALLGFGFGGTLLAMFMRVGGGIFTKAADVGADLVGKVEKDIPEDDPRNAAVIADLVGDNVGDCAGMAADIFESYEVTIVSGLMLGLALMAVDPTHSLKWIVFPLIIRAIGVISSILGTFTVPIWAKFPIKFLRAHDAEEAMFRSYEVSSVNTIVCSFLIAVFYAGDWRLAMLTSIGVALAVAFNPLTSYFTSTKRKPVKEIVESTKTGAATTILSGLSVG
ncbi:MAG: pyruvate kinase, partial [Candidatus Bipolaricaulota bacterium]|nr:pyruvate kinase [Candidatus Bipolaricaulota bacterium]